MIRWPAFITIAFIIVLGLYFRPQLTKQIERGGVPASEIKAILPRDAVAAIVEPKFTPLTENSFSPNTQVLSLSVGEDHRAYPLPIMNWHEVADDVVGGKKVAITYCPLTLTGVAFERGADGQEFTFGVSGKLYKNNLVMYDKQTNSLWSQMAAAAIAGKRVGTKLSPLPLTRQTLGEFEAAHPRGLVLAKPTGSEARNYDIDPYKDYAASPTALGIFGATVADQRIPPKTAVWGVEQEGTFTAYPVDHPPPKDTQATLAYWFAWADFHRATVLYNKQ